MKIKIKNTENGKIKIHMGQISTSDALGRDHPHVVGTMKNIGMVLAKQGQLDKAMAKFKEERRIYKALNDGHRDGPCCNQA